jgi:hypothetical protein
MVSKATADGFSSETTLTPRRRWLRVFFLSAFSVVLRQSETGAVFGITAQVPTTSLGATYLRAQESVRLKKRERRERSTMLFRSNSSLPKLR